mgnify:CR=1 FL=1
MDSPQNSVRLDRIETKIDQMAEAMISIARAEEKILAMEQKYSTQYDRINKLSEKMDIVTTAVAENSRTSASFQKAFWMVFAAVVSAAIAHFYMT